MSNGQESRNLLGCVKPTPLLTKPHVQPAAYRLLFLSPHKFFPSTMAEFFVGGNPSANFVQGHTNKLLLTTFIVTWAPRKTKVGKQAGKLQQNLSTVNKVFQDLFNPLACRHGFSPGVL